MIIAGRRRAFLDIADVKHRFGGEQAEHAEGAFLFGLALEKPRRPALAQQHQRAVDEVELLLGLLVVALGFFGQIVDTLFQAVEIGEHQFGLDGLDIGQWRELAEPGIGHCDLADIRLDGAERVIRRLRRRGFRQRVEQRRLAYIGQPDDTAFESHFVLNDFSLSWPGLSRSSTSCFVPGKERSGCPASQTSIRSLRKLDRFGRAWRRSIYFAPARDVSPASRRLPRRKIPCPAAPDAPCSGMSSPSRSRAARRYRQSLRRAP